MNIDLYSLALVSVMALSLLFLRAFPFLALRCKETPVLIEYLGKYLPYAIMGMMVVYCLKETRIMGSFHGIPELIAILVTVAMQLWKKNSLMAIVLGTATYVILVNYIFIG